MTQTVLLGDIIDVVKGISYRSADYSDSENGLAFVTLKSVERGGGYSRSGIKYYAGELKDTQYVEPGDILIANTDLTQNREIIGSPLIMPDLGRKACFSLDLSKLVIKDPDQLDKDYLFYYLKSPQVRDYMISHSNGSTVMHLSVKSVPKMPIKLPEISEQRRVGRVLREIDEKIELNRQTNETLEQMGQALFRHYFIDNPEAEKWKDGKLGDLFDITMGQSPPGSSYSENGEGAVFYQGRAEFGVRFPNRRLSTTDPKRLANRGDVLLSVRAPVGDINQATEGCCIGRGLAAISSRTDQNSFCYYSCKNLQARFAEYNSEGTVFGAINGKQLNSLSVKVPPTSVTQEFEEQAAQIDGLILKNVQQTQTLATLRDTLLPRFINGKVKV